MLWYSARSEQAEFASSGSQDPKLLKSNFSNSFSCLCFAVSFCVLDAFGLILCIYHAWLHLWLRHPIGSYHSFHWDLLLQSLRVCCTISHYDSDILAAIVHLGVSIVYYQALGQWKPPLQHVGVWVITFSHTLVNVVFICACIILDEKALIISLPLVVTTSLYSVESSTLVVTLSSSNVMVTHQTAKR